MLPGLGMSIISEWGDTPADEMSGLRMSTIPEWVIQPLYCQVWKLIQSLNGIIHQPGNEYNL